MKNTALLLVLLFSSIYLYGCSERVTNITIQKVGDTTKTTIVKVDDFTGDETTEVTCVTKGEIYDC